MLTSGSSTGPSGWMPSTRANDRRGRRPRPCVRGRILDTFGVELTLQTWLPRVRGRTYLSLESITRIAVRVGRSFCAERMWVTGRNHDHRHDQRRSPGRRYQRASSRSGLRRRRSRRKRRCTLESTTDTSDGEEAVSEEPTTVQSATPTTTAAPTTTTEPTATAEAPETTGYWPYSSKSAQVTQ